MKFNKFVEMSLIAGVCRLNLELQGWLKRSGTELSLLDCFIILSVFFEPKGSSIGPGRMAQAFGYSRSRLSQQISELCEDGLLRRTLEPRNARKISLELTQEGHRVAKELVKVFSKLQRLIDSVIGERVAESMNKKLNQAALEIRSTKRALVTGSAI